ncbi:Hypothetical protein, putative [Bodo saltans]|uniref:Uncharacterized protein n=1 Tax=Bodo saltans TaxID=75058 RepID=A0A0S4JXH7_BODSA|nr:Hypothetical protein, putative [Bodo saltans]|eukprot:CUG94136.1 Hypothetical protein, putative [Bodo saltans]
MHMSSIFRSCARSSAFPAADLVHSLCGVDESACVTPHVPSTRSFARQIQRIEEQGRKSLCASAVAFYPLSLPVGHKSAPYRALDFTGSIDPEHHQWVFFGQLRKELMSHQLANLLIDLVAVEPLLIVKKMQCMHVLLRSADEAEAVKSLSGCLLLDYQGAWFADNAEKMQLLSRESEGNPIRFLPKAPVTIEPCAKPPVIHGAIGKLRRSPSASSSASNSSTSSLPLPH